MGADRDSDSVPPVRNRDQHERQHHPIEVQGDKPEPEADQQGNPADPLERVQLVRTAGADPRVREDQPEADGRVFGERAEHNPVDLVASGEEADFHNADEDPIPGAVSDAPHARSLS